MFYHVLFPLHQTFSVFNVFRYLTFRTAYAALTALLISILIGPYVIRMLQRLQVGQVIRQDGPKSHYSKAGTPTMGGLLIIGTMTLATLLWANLTVPYIWMALLTTLAFGAVGFWDDYLKKVRKSSAGLCATYKFLLEIAIARSEERRVEKECIYRWCRCVSKKNSKSTDMITEASRNR